MTHPARLRAPRSGMVLLDLQPGLLARVPGGQEILAGCLELVRIAGELGLPLLLGEIAPARFGALHPDLLELLTALGCPWDRVTRDCWCLFDDEPALRRVAGMDRSQLVLAGVEAHVSVLLTGVAALARGYDLHVPLGCTGSRLAEDERSARATLRQIGAYLVPRETVFAALRSVIPGEE